MPSIKLSDLVASLRSSLCPACGRAKSRNQTVCGTCYANLPQGIRARLYHRVGHGYEQAVADAMTSLKVQAPHLPPAGQREPGTGRAHWTDSDAVAERDDATAVVPIGRHRGSTLAAVLANDPTYLPWLRTADGITPELAEAVGRFCDEHDDEITAAVEDANRKRRKW